MIFQIEFECALKRNAQIKIKNGEKMKKIFTFAVIALLLIVHNSEARVLSFAEKPSNYIQLIDGINDKLLKYKNEIFVIGHKVPDTDTVCTAIVYANLKRHLGLNCKPMISGKMNNETKFVLTYWGIDVPEILTNASGKNMYGMHGHKISISSILAKDEITQQSLCQRLLKVMENADNSIEHRYAFVIDKKNHKTELIYSGNGAEEKAKKAFKANSEGKIIFNFDVSRKLDIVPPLTEAYKQ